MKVYTATTGASCGFNFAGGERYLVYADWNPYWSILATSNCTRTRAIAGAAADIDSLGSPLSAVKPDRIER